MKKITCIISIIALLMSTSCSKESTNTNIDTRGVIYILGEGNFGSANAKVDLYQIDSQKLTQNYYETINGAPAGDVLQSMTKIGSYYVLAVNNSNKLLWLSSNSFKHMFTTDIDQPRYMFPISSTQLIVTSMKGSVYIVNSSGTIERTIRTGKYTERIVRVGERYYIEFQKMIGSSDDKQGYYVLDAKLNLVDSILTDFVPTNSYTMSNQIYARFNDPKFTAPSQIRTCNPSTKATQKISDLVNPGYGDLAAGMSDKYYYYDNSKIYSISSGANPTVVGTTPALSAPYSLKSIANRQMLVLIDAKDYSSRSDIYILNANDASVKSQFSGPVNASFVFED